MGEQGDFCWPVSIYSGCFYFLLLLPTFEPWWLKERKPMFLSLSDLGRTCQTMGLPSCWNLQVLLNVNSLIGNLGIKPHARQWCRGSCQWQRNVSSSMRFPMWHTGQSICRIGRSKATAKSTLASPLLRLSFPHRHMQMSAKVGKVCVCIYNITYMIQVDVEIGSVCNWTVHFHAGKQLG